MVIRFFFFKLYRIPRAILGRSPGFHVTAQLTRYTETQRPQLCNRRTSTILNFSKTGETCNLVCRRNHEWRYPSMDNRDRTSISQIRNSASSVAATRRSGPSGSGRSDRIRSLVLGRTPSNRRPVLERLHKIANRDVSARWLY